MLFVRFLIFSQGIAIFAAVIIHEIPQVRALFVHSRWRGSNDPRNVRLDKFSNTGTQ
jgi:hypothetical protein